MVEFTFLLLCTMGVVGEGMDGWGSRHKGWMCEKQGKKDLKIPCTTSFYVLGLGLWIVWARWHFLIF